MHKLIPFVALMVACSAGCVGQAHEQQQPPANDVPEIRPTEIRAKTTIALPGTVDDICFGGGGRYILLQFSGLKKIGIFDVNVAEITRYIDLPDSSSQFAAGLTKLILISGDGKEASCFDLETGEAERTIAIDLPNPPKFIVMGSETDGPAVFLSETRLKAIDTDLNVSPLKVSGEYNFSLFKNGQARISNNGDTIGVWKTSSHPSGLISIRKVGDNWITAYNHDSVGTVVPSANGRLLFTGQDIYDNRNHRLTWPLKSQRYDDPKICEVPSIQYNFYLRVSVFANTSRRETVTLHQGSDDLVLGELTGLLPIGEYQKELIADRNCGKLTLEKRLSFFPAANLIAQLSKSRNKLVLIPFNLEEALKSTDQDFLFVTSSPPKEIAVGTQLRYEITSMSKSDNISHILADGPTGMTVSRSGVILWKTTTDSPKESTAIVAITNSEGREVFHAFSLKVLGAKGQSNRSTNMPSFPAELKCEPAEPPIAAGEAIKKIKLPSALGEMVVGGGGRFILIHLPDLEKIGLLDVSQGKIVKYFSATDDQTLIAASANHFVIISQDQGVISRYNLTTFKRELTRTIPFNRPIQYVAMGSNSQGPLIVRWTDGTTALDRANFGCVDLKTLEESKEIAWCPNPLQWWEKPPTDRFRNSNLIRASSNGKVFTINGIGPYEIKDTDTSSSNSKASRQVVPLCKPSILTRNHLIPAKNGDYFVTGGQLLDSKLKPLQGKANKRDYRVAIIPSISGSYYLRFVRAGMGGEGHYPEGESKPSTSLFHFGNRQPLAFIPDLKPPTPLGNNSGFNTPLPDTKLFFVPELKVVVSAIPTEDDVLIMRRLDIREAGD